MSKTSDTKPTRELTKDELSLVSGGAVDEAKAEAQIFQALSSAISEVMKNFGGALNTAARGG
jgi:bacteriocin-like protein